MVVIELAEDDDVLHVQDVLLAVGLVDKLHRIAAALDAVKLEVSVLHRDDGLRHQAVPLDEGHGRGLVLELGHQFVLQVEAAHQVVGLLVQQLGILAGALNLLDAAPLVDDHVQGFRLRGVGRDAVNDGPDRLLLVDLTGPRFGLSGGAEVRLHLRPEQVQKIAKYAHFHHLKYCKNSSSWL